MVFMPNDKQKIWSNLNLHESAVFYYYFETKLGMHQTSWSIVLGEVL